MPHDATLIETLVAAIGLAFLFGAVANRLHVPCLVGYLAAGIVVGPYTPGFVADLTLAPQLAELGVILLMFGVGLHFSPRDLVEVGTIAVPGAVAQIAAATLLGWGLAWAMGWGAASGIVFGLALSVASTVVLLRALQDRRILDSERGRVAVGWLVVEDLVTVLVLVFLPVMAALEKGGGAGLPTDWLAERLGLGLGGLVGLTLLKVALFVVLMLAVGRRAVPWVLHRVAHTGSRELFRLAVLAIALGIAFGAARLFGVSLALGAFFAGMILSESELSQRAAQESLPLRDAFAVLFFVSVGMMFDPAALVHDPLSVLGVLFVILVGKSLAAFLIVIAFRRPAATALTIAASLAQIGEFSFILVDLGIRLDFLPERARTLILAGAILSILANPLAFTLVERLSPLVSRRLGEPAAGPIAGPEPPPRRTDQRDHVVLAGFDQVGCRVAATLAERKLPFLVIEDGEDAADRAQSGGIEVVRGNAADAATLAAANVGAARTLVVTIPHAFEAGQVVEQARALNPGLRIVARAYSEPETRHLSSLGADLIITGTDEVARAIARHLEEAAFPPPGDEAASAAAS